MGQSLSKHFISKGFKVALLDIDEKGGSALGKQLPSCLKKDNCRVLISQLTNISESSLGENAKFFKCNVASYSSQAEAFKSVWHTWGRLDALLMNAGITDRSSLFIFAHKNNAVDDVPPEPNLLCTDVDYKGVLYGTQLATHFMRHNSPAGGKIVATASVAGIHPHRSYPEYNGAKSGVVQFVRSMAPILKDKENIYINCVCPGIVATNIIPPKMVAAVQEECMTPVDTIVKAYDGCIAGGDEQYGEILEATGTEVSSVNPERLEFRNGKPSTRAVTVWDPLFKDLHGELSGLEEALP